MCAIAGSGMNAGKIYCWGVGTRGQIPTPPDPIYLFCVGVNAHDDATPVSIAGEVIAL